MLGLGAVVVCFLFFCQISGSKSQGLPLGLPGGWGKPISEAVRLRYTISLRVERRTYQFFTSVLVHMESTNRRATSLIMLIVYVVDEGGCYLFGHDMELFYDLPVIVAVRKC